MRSDDFGSACGVRRGGCDTVPRWHADGTAARPCGPATSSMRGVSGLRFSGTGLQHIRAVTRLRRWAYSRLPDPVHQYYYVQPGPDL